MGHQGGRALIFYNYPPTYIYDMYTLYFYGSPDYKNWVTRKFALHKNVSDKNCFSWNGTRHMYLITKGDYKEPTG